MVTRFEFQAVSAEAADAGLSLDPVGLDPFVNAKGEKSFFVTPALRQRIELVRHLLEFGRQIIVLTGISGAGKSALLDRISDPGEKPWHVLRYTAGPTLNRSSLLRKIATELKIDPAPSDDAHILESIRERIQAANQRGESPVMTVDDAHRLPADTTGFIASLAHCVDERAELKIVLSADPTQSALVDQLQSESSLRTLVHVVEVPRLNGEQVGAMLVHRWRAAYGTDEIPLDAAAMEQISQASSGIPGKAIVLARQVQILANRAKPQPTDPALRYLVGGIVVIVLFIGFAFFNVEHTDDTHETEIALPREPIATSPPSSTTAPMDLSTTTDPEIDLSYAPENAEFTVDDAALPVPVPDPVTPAIKNEPAPIATPAAPIAVANPPAPSTPALSSGTQVELEPTPAPVELPESPPVSPTPNRPSQARPTPDIVAPYSIDWLRSRAPGGYVLQLFGVRDRVAAVKFINERKLGGKTTVLVTNHAGSPWYVVVYGHYPDRAAALAAIGRLPANLASTTPWARPIASFD